MNTLFPRALTTPCFFGLMLAALSIPASALGQGVLVDTTSTAAIRLPRPIAPPHLPHPPATSYKIKTLKVQAQIVNQIAKVQVSQSFVNTGSRPMEVCFMFPLPYDGAIDRLTLLVDGKEYPAKLLDAKQARKMYEEIVRKNQDPALLEWLGQGMFKTSVFPVPPGAERAVALRYTQVLRKNQNLTEFLFPLSTAKYTSQPVEQIEFRLSVESETNLKNLYSPTHAVEVERPDAKHATVSFKIRDHVPTSDFRLFYDAATGPLATSVISYRPQGGDEGYFLMLASPEIKSPQAELPRKTVLLVLDRSGSMDGKKLIQAKESLKHVLNNLRAGDRFNILAYDSEIESFRPELQKYNEQTRSAAATFIDGLYAGGSTNIAGALERALTQLQDENQLNQVLFFTDGLPTAGETNESKIVAATEQANKVRARMFVLGLGYDVNSRLLDRLARANFGQSEYVRPDEDIEASVARLYRRIAAPVMTDLEIQFAADAPGEVVSRVYPRNVHDLFAGEQLVLAGRYKVPGRVKITLSGKVTDKQRSFDFAANFVEISPDDTNAFVEKIWAMRRVGEILDELDLKGDNQELVAELVTLSTRHGILTPYTSFMADESGQAPQGGFAGAVQEATNRLQYLEGNEGGESGFAQRKAKASFQRAEQLGSAGAYADLDEDKTVTTSAVQNIGDKTFFWRDGRWVDSTITPADQQQAQIVKRFSSEYFELVNREDGAAAKYFSLDQPLVVKLEGQVYQCD